MASSGFLNIDKPPGMTSHDIVAKVRRGTGVKKVGHAGTLDPMATGVLIVCLGYATRLSDFVMNHTKIYAAEVVLGIETDTYDAEGQTVKASDTPVTLAQVEAILPQFRGEIEQIPPMYSAIKQGGKKLYELARQGQSVERPARPVNIENLTLTTWEYPRFSLQITCSPGTYIRSLAHDMGQILGVGAHLTALRRLASGDFRVENAVTFATLQEAMQRQEWSGFLYPPDSALQAYTRIDLSDEESQRVQHGGFIEYTDASTPLLRAYRPDGQLLALLEPVPDSDSLWKPNKVFNDQTF